MAEDKKQSPTRGMLEEELDLIRVVFKENDDLLIAMRALLYGLPISPKEKEMIRTTFTSEKLMKIIWKRFCPSLNRETPIGQTQEVWIGAEEMIFDKMPSSIEQAINYKHEAILLMKKGIGLLVDPDGEPMNLEFNPLSYPNDHLGVHLLARNQYIKSIELQLLGLKLAAAQAVVPQDEDKGKDGKKKPVINKNSNQ